MLSEVMEIRRAELLYSVKSKQFFLKKSRLNGAGKVKIFYILQNGEMQMINRYY